MRETMLEALRPQALREPVLSNSQELIDYLTAEMAHLPREHLRVLFLDANNRLIADETLALGTTRQVPLYPREIVRRALELGATALILAHNHPSGDPEPSNGDLDATRLLQDIAHALDLEVHDHLIIARSGWRSMRAMGAV